MTIIDIHVHPVAKHMVKDQRNLRAMERECGKRLGSTPIEMLLASMDAGGISKACLLGPSPCDGINLTNDMVHAIVQSHPQRLFGFVGVDPTARDNSATKTEIERAVSAWGFKGVGEFGGIDYLVPEWEIVFETCIALQIPVLVHVGVPLPSMLLKYGNPSFLDELANRYPDLKIIAAHVGMPWILETIAVAVRHDNVYVDISALPAFRKELIPFILSVCLERGLEDRVLFGSDFPVVDPGQYAKSLSAMQVPAPARWLLKLPSISPQFKKKVLAENAMKLLKLEL